VSGSVAPVPPQKGSRQARGLERRRQILDAAFELFAANGYRSTTVAAVAAAVGMTDAGVLHHFPSKDELLLAVLADRDQPDPDAELFAAEPGGGLASLRRLPVFARVLLDRPSLMHFDAVVGGEAIAEGGPTYHHFRRRMALVRAGLEAMLRVGIERGELRADIDVPAVAAEINAFMWGIQAQWLLDPEAIDLEAAYLSYVEGLENQLT
jgi:AcrR family transcriptional regulator